MNSSQLVFRYAFENFSIFNLQPVFWHEKSPETAWLLGFSSISFMKCCIINYTDTLVEATRFELTTSWSRTKRATKLRYASLLFASLFIISNHSLFCKCFLCVFLIYTAFRLFNSLHTRKRLYFFCIRNKRALLF